MKVILLTDIPKVGSRYDVKEFKDGYAINVLISKGLAEMATPHALAKLSSKKAEMDKKREEEEQSFLELIASVDNKKIILNAKANEKGHLFKAVSPRDVAGAIKESSGVTIDPDTLVMDHIKEVGTHAVIIKKGKKSGKCEIVVEALN